MERNVVSEADAMVVHRNKAPSETETARMRHGGADVRGKAKPGPDIRFEPRNLASHSGPIVFRHLLPLLGVGERLRGCFRHLGTNPIYDHHAVMMLLVVHPIIGHRRLRDMDSHRDDGMVKRIPGPKRLPDVSAVSRSLVGADVRSVAKVRNEASRPVMERLARGIFRSDTRLRRVGVEHRAPCRRNGGGLQREKEGCAQPPSPFLPSPGPIRSLMAFIAPGTSTTPTGPKPSSATV